MPRFVYLDDVIAAMSEYAPPGWCKLALHGALLTERVSLYAARGKVRGYLPPYHIQEDNPPLPQLIRAGFSQAQLISRYNLQDVPRPNTTDIDIWTDEWENEARQIAVGWLMFDHEFEWPSPTIQFKHFEIPRDLDTYFSYDDIHSDTEPDPALYHEARFEKLCLALQDAETLVPMARFEGEAFKNTGSTAQSVLGRPGGTGYHAEDGPIVQKMLAEYQANPSIRVRQLAKKYAGEAVGAGTPESIIKRLERRFKASL